MWINPFFDESPGAPVLTELFPDWAAGDGIFDALEEVADLPWEGVVQSTDLDLEYFGNHSGAKFGAPLPVKLWLNGDLELSDEDRKTLARIIWLKFKQPWQHLWETTLVTYNPIHNYDMNEVRNLVKEESRVSSAESEDNSVSGTESDSHSKDFVYGLNSAGEGKPSNAYDSSDASGSSEARAGKNSGDEAKEGAEAETLRRSGNIGVTTTQQMIQQERAVWAWNFFEQIYKDVDSVLALSVYDGCRV